MADKYKITINITSGTENENYCNRITVTDEDLESPAGTREIIKDLYEVIMDSKNYFDYKKLK